MRRIGPYAWLSVALVAATFASYAGVRDHAFLNFDDPQYVTDNAVVLAGLSARGVRWAFTTFHFANWSPVTWLSLMLDSDLFGARAGPRLGMNVALHTAAAVALDAALRRASGARGRSLVVAGLFALHPCTWNRWHGSRRARTCSPASSGCSQ